MLVGFLIGPTLGRESSTRTKHKQHTIFEQDGIMYVGLNFGDTQDRLCRRWIVDSAQVKVLSSVLNVGDIYDSIPPVN